jgi:hypothetical protein
MLYDKRKSYLESTGTVDDRFGAPSGTISMPTYNTIKPNISFPVSSKIKTITPPKVNLGEASSVFDNIGNKDDIRAVAGLAGNLITANKLKTDIPTQIVNNKPFVYKNRTGFLTDRNRANFRNFLRNRTGMPIDANQAYATTLNANNQIAAMEGEREDKAIESYNNRDLQISATNTEAFNRNMYINNMLTNQKTGLKGSAFTNFLTNLDTNDLQKSTLEKETKALQIMGLGLNYGRADNLFESLMKNFPK